MKAQTVLMRTGFKGMFSEEQKVANVTQAKSYDFNVEAARPFLM